MNTSDDRIKEVDMVVPILRFIRDTPRGFITTCDLVLELEALFHPNGKDAEGLQNRSDSDFSQKVEEFVSRKDSPASFIAKGFAKYVDEEQGLQITIKGKLLLKDLGA